jgi:hypothetical protein
LALAARLSLARSTTALNASGLRTARSASAFRSSSIPAAFSPLMKREYERSWALTAALMRAIQRLRTMRFFFYRST